MKFQRFAVLFVPLAIISSVAVGQAFGEGNATDIEKVANEWAARENVIKTGRIKWSQTETRPKEFAARFAGRLRDPKDAPTKDLVLKGSCEWVMDGTKVRYVYDGQMWSPKTRQLEPKVTVSTFDGKLFGYTILRCPIVSHPEATIQSESASEELKAVEVLPIWFSMRGTHLASEKLSIRDFRSTGKSITLNQRECREFVFEDTNTTARRQLFIDMAHGCQVVRLLETNNGHVSLQVDVSYREESNFGWVPSEWEYSVCAANGAIALSGRCTVTELALNPTVPASEFVPETPPGSRVADLTSGAEIQYGILPDGSKGRTIRHEKGRGPILYEQLMTPPTRSAGRLMIWLLPTLALVSVIAAIVLFRIRRGRRAAQTQLPLTPPNSD